MVYPEVDHSTHFCAVVGAAAVGRLVQREYNVSLAHADLHRLSYIRSKQMTQSATQILYNYPNRDQVWEC